jgi:hypothetical protein
VEILGRSGRAELSAVWRVLLSGAGAALIGLAATAYGQTARAAPDTPAVTLKTIPIRSDPPAPPPPAQSAKTLRRYINFDPPKPKQTAPPPAPLAALTKPVKPSTLSPGSLDCASKRITPQLETALRTSFDDLENAPFRANAFEQLYLVVDSCVVDNGWGIEKFEPYFDYSLTRMTRMWLIPDLQKAGMNIAKIDDAFNFGPGRISILEATKGKSDKQVDLIIDTLQTMKIDMTTLSEKRVKSLLLYILATWQYWDAVEVMG